jgi:hypothetical protein
MASSPPFRYAANEEINGRFGYKAVVQVNSSSAAAFEGKADL